ncbi:hypothetical protein [Mycobacterium paraffinicum]|uniref:hypothetical protein n=1 Tax=Mycobacterium paraffinicum TaxID=53378 RepID=UPI0021F2641B|nr:hypothetical protein [Mycobacterium paraffinicum]
MTVKFCALVSGNTLGLNSALVEQQIAGTQNVNQVFGAQSIGFGGVEPGVAGHRRGPRDERPTRLRGLSFGVFWFGVFGFGAVDPSPDALPAAACP